MVSFVAVVVKCQFCLSQCHGYMQILIFQLNGEEGIYEALVKNADSFSGGVSMSVNVQLAFNLLCVFDCFTFHRIFIHTQVDQNHFEYRQ